MNRFWKAVLITTVVAGTLDITAAHIDQIIRTGEFPYRMFYFIAAGAIGLKAAFTNGSAIIALGIFIHYFISFAFTLFFFLIYPAVRRVSKNLYVNVLWYTLVVWLTMNFIVLPLTALPQKPFVFNVHQFIGFLILLVVFGLPIVLMTGKYYKRGIAESIA